jgi:excisionase family DNA binding protein
MTKEELAKVLRIKPSTVYAMARAGKIPRIPRIRQLRFDPETLMAIFCQAPALPEPRSLTIERHKTGAKTNGGIRKCL